MFHRKKRLIVITMLFFVSGCVERNQPVDAETYTKEALYAKETMIPKEIQALGEKVAIKRVIDGDTVEVTGENGDETVRLAMIDTPETVHPEKPQQKFGKEASDFAKTYLSKDTYVILERAYHKKDRYNRTLGYLWVGDVNFNQLMVSLGYARVAFVDSKEPYVAAFEEAEEAAKRQKFHIWSIDGYVTKHGFSMNVVKKVMYRLNR